MQGDYGTSCTSFNPNIEKCPRKRVDSNAVLIDRGDPGDRPRNDQAGKQLVALELQQFGKREFHQPFAGVTSAPTRSTISL